MDPIELHASVELAAVPQSARAARRFISDICNAANLDEDECATASLLTSELVTNAVRYGGSQAVLEAATPGGVLRVSVRDANPDLPAVGDSPAVTSEGGRGMLLVDSLASRWGVEPTADGGKAVWFELDLPSA
ncbi:MAG: putative anti-sigma regulatory factor, serine/threonine protein kinase [Nocardioides sp.]|nr:putative anti-sigma regulatory factor, serine/threonine protein kinase [Nocardioides sp.]